MPISTAPYKREYRHTKSRGSEKTVRCSSCGREVPRYKTFVKFGGMNIDKSMLQQMDVRQMHLMRRIMRLCPACARFRGVSKPGKSVRKKHIMKTRTSRLTFRTRESAWRRRNNY